MVQGDAYDLAFSIDADDGPGEQRIYKQSDDDVCYDERWSRFRYAAVYADDEWRICGTGCSKDA